MCEHCSKILTEEVQVLLTHCKTCRKVSRPDNFHKYVCYCCSFHTISKRDMTHHIRTHTGEKPHKCFCGYRTARKDTLMKHFRRHTGVKPYKCLICDYSSASSSNLKRHGKLHEGKERLFHVTLINTN